MSGAEMDIILVGLELVAWFGGGYVIGSIAYFAMDRA